MSRCDHVSVLNHACGREDSEMLEVGALQYEAYTQALTDSSNGRRMFHTIFIGTNTLVFALFPFLMGNGESLIDIDEKWLLGANAVGVGFSFLWWLIVLKYRRETRISLGVLSDAEKYLPFRFYTVEYERKKASPKWKQVLFRLAEPSIPWVFGLVHIVIAGIGFGF